MIEPEQAEDIVRDCINETVSTGEEYSADKPLGLFGIIAPEVVSTFKLKIRRDKDFGVKAFNHILAASALDDLGEDTLAGEVEDIIVDNAEPIQEKTKKKKKEVKL